jgi:hypothetical protein
MNNIIRAERATVKFCEGVEVDGYRLPSGEFRVGKVGSARALGYGKDWVTRTINGVASGKGKDAETLIKWGFNGVASSVEVLGSARGTTVADTISLQDFRQLIRLAAKRGKPEAEALLDALLDVGLEDWFRLAFGQEQLTLEEKRDRFYKAYAATINWLAEDRREWALIEEQELFLAGSWA